jgi:putative transposase
MQALGLQARRWRRRFVPQTTLCDPRGPVAPNLLAERAAPTAVNQVWVADITYLPTGNGFVYLPV